MKRILSLFAAALLLGITANSTLAQVSAAPTLVNFQGRLANPSGNPVPNGTYSIRFSLWDAATGGTEKWNQTIAAVQVRNGTFAVLLNINTANLFNSNLWFEIKVGADAALTPRQQIVSVPFALKSNSVADGSITNNSIANGTITNSKFASGTFNTLAWLLGGNAGTNPANQFLGTSDAQPLVFRTNNAERFRLDTSGRAFLGRPNAIGAGRLILSEDTSSFTGMYIDSGVNGLPFYGYTQNGANAAWTYLDGSDSNKWKIYHNGDVVQVSPYRAVIGAGGVNYRGSVLVGGHPGNSVTDDVVGVTVWGGFEQDALFYPNSASNIGATVSGGGGNQASGFVSTVSGGTQNTASGVQSVVVGGFFNRATNRQSVVLGGGDTVASGAGAIAAGDGVVASGLLATAIGGSGNVAQGDFSHASGYFAKALHSGSAVWSDATAPLPAGFASTAPNQFLIRATGGVGIGTNAPTAQLDVNGNIRSRGGDFILNGRGGGFGNSGGAGRALVDTGNGSQVGYGGLVINFFNDYGQVWVDSDLLVSGTVSQVSDARYKRGVMPLSASLDAVLNLQGVTYFWDESAFPNKTLSQKRQIGFIAQEVEKTLPDLVTTNTQGYKSVNYVGVVPVLVEAIKTQQRHIETLKKDKDTLKAKNAELEARQDALEARLNALEKLLHAQGQK